jgi:hypothetical protein
MCMENGLPKVQLGVPLDEEVLSTMPAEERSFWENFLVQARQEVADSENAGFIRPLVPSQSLLASYRRGLIEYDGAQYCQVQQLARIFVFSAIQ